MCTFFQLPSKCELLLWRHLEVFGDDDTLGKAEKAKSRGVASTPVRFSFSECGVCRQDFDSQSGR